MEKLSGQMKETIRDGLTFFKWLLYACGIGVLVGGVGVAFHYSIDWATELRLHNPDLIWLLPAGGVSIVLLYRICGMEKDRGTNLVLVAVREAQPMKLRTAPLIFLSTIITHLVGGSAGREGAALQLGGSLSAYVGRKMRLDALDSRVLVLCGMSAAFSALFGTPLTAAVFAMEVVSVGRMYYGVMVPCFVSSMIGKQVARACGLHLSVGYLISGVPLPGVVPMVQAAGMGVMCAVLSVLFCRVMHAAPRLYGGVFRNPYARAAAGGILVLTLTLLVGSQDYNGAGDALIRRMLGGEDIPLAFLLKILFTALTLGAGFRGGEIVPVLCTGAAFGTVAGPVLGLSQSFGGALGMTAAFCGATNCPLSSIFLAYELFSGRGLSLHALCCAVAYALSGYYGLYSEQKIVYSKFRAEWVDRSVK